MSLFHRIVVPIDFSPAAETAWRRAPDVAAPGATIVAVNVVTAPYPDVAYANIPAAVREQHAENEARLARLTAGTAIAPAPARVEHRVVDGDVTKGLLDTIRETHADLVVVGVHARHGLDRLLRGSVVSALVREAPCSVLVVKTPVLSDA